MRSGSLALIVGLVGCGAPISNAPFLEEAAFLSPLPSRAQIGPPERILLAPNADNPLLGAAKQAAAEYDQLIEFPLAVGQWLRTISPDERSEVRRSWSASELLVAPPAALTTSDDRLHAWVRAQVIRPLDGDFELEIELAAEEEGPWTLVATGNDDAAGTGRLVWDFAATVDALALVPPVPLATFEAAREYTMFDVGAAPVRVVEVDLGELPLVARSWVIGGQVLLAFSGELPVMADGTARPGAAVVWHDDDGGWGQGSVLDGGIERGFQVCWDALGTVTWAGGDPGTLSTGVASACVADAFALP